MAENETPVDPDATDKPEIPPHLPGDPNEPEHGKPPKKATPGDQGLPASSDEAPEE